MKYLKTFERSGNNNENLVAGFNLVISIVNLINNVYKNTLCYYVKAGRDTYHVILGDSVVLSVFYYRDKFVLDLYKLGYIKLTKNIHKYLTFLFSGDIPKARGVLNSGSISHYTGYTEYRKNNGFIPIFIDELTIDKYEQFLIKDNVEKFNL